ncbi:hypothetical protein [Bowdeniella nasicola]|uniref:hypothetical protein n=1 Tax=Bowdeniella nasicola TaxID=208480 RepID=UPI001160F497|nr:hypothetical protein [Bowdeniella nasicola]
MLQPPVEPAQQSAYDIANWECSAKYSVDPAHDGTFTPEQYTVIYEYYTQYFIPCAKAAGVKWKDPTIPSFEEFKQRMNGGEEMPWIPASTYTWQVDSLSIGDTTTEEGKQFWKRCPADPPHEYLYP